MGSPHDRNEAMCRQYWVEGRSLQEIANHVGLSRNAIWQIVQRARTPAHVEARARAHQQRKEQTMTAQQLARTQKRAARMIERDLRQQTAIKLLKQRVSERDIAAQLGVSVGTVRALIAPYRVRVNADQLETFRLLRQAGKTYDEIAATTGYSSLTVRDWLNLQRHVAQEADAWLRSEREAEAWFAEIADDVA